MKIRTEKQSFQIFRDQPLFSYTHYISHEGAPNKDKRLLNMLALVVMTRSRYTSPLLANSIDSENNLKDSPHLLDFNKATKDAMANSWASKEIRHVLGPKSIRLLKNLREITPIREFLLQKSDKG